MRFSPKIILNQNVLICRMIEFLCHQVLQFLSIGNIFVTLLICSFRR
jgi:hypothetical protein